MDNMPNFADIEYVKNIRRKKIITLFVFITIAIILMVGIYNSISEKRKTELYAYAEELLSKKDYLGARQAFEKCNDYKDTQNRILECNYLEAINNYQNGKYLTALNVLKKLDDYNSDTHLYMEFCKAHLYGPEDRFTTIYENIDFEDAKDLLTWNDQMFCRYMLGTWRLDLSSDTISMEDDGDGIYTLSNMPELPDGGGFEVSKGVFRYQYPNTNKWVDFFDIKILSKKKFTLKLKRSGKTYSFTKV